MLISHEREKLLNAIIFFAKNSSYLGKIKLWKLLYFLDFEHFKETGRSVTGMRYNAWPMGPVPVSLHNEVEAPGADMAEKIRFGSKVVNGSNSMLTVTPLTEFDPSHFSKRELRLMERLAADFYKTKAEDMIEATHLENQPWHKIYNELGLKQQEIPFDLALRTQEQEELRHVVRERDEILANCIH
ncbi:Panacea domain-containing protein [Janthinobacterium sp. NKUCC08_JDC]|uniref:Panacea domain-containing protein n=1 Tax=Janthinobacterium sp. NKUCC08_JDC TaxID=2842122 RepID=UPI001C5B818D|nr:Panacea domain-containing protein [Janthinobacterium sp. NKUCC08_JDC]MBW3499404.1 SocA family protein [Janthinobacterium sp. NKUCC08_JDC]